MAVDPVVSCASPYVALSREALVDFCRRWEIDDLRLAGSAVHGPFRPDSDLDFVVHASYRARIFEARGTATAAAVRELEATTGRRVDLVSARLIALGHTYVSYNLLVAHRFERRLSLLAYLEQAATALAKLPDPVAAVRSAWARPGLLTALLVLGRVCDRAERIAVLRDAGLTTVPWEAACDVLLPVVAAARRQAARPWAGDEILTTLVRALSPHFAEMATCARAALDREGPAPELPEEARVRARGDAPAVPRRGDRLPTEPRLSLRDPNDPRGEALVAIARRFRIHRLIERIGDDDGPSTFAAFAGTRSPLYTADGAISSDAARAFAGLGANVRCARRIALDANPFAMHAAFVRDRGDSAAIGAWYVREAARLLEGPPFGAAADPTAAVRRLAQAGEHTPVEARVAWGLGALPWTRAAEAAGDAAASKALVPVLLAARDAMLRANDPSREGEIAYVPRGLVIDALGDVTPESEARFR